MRVKTKQDWQIWYMWLEQHMSVTEIAEELKLTKKEINASLRKT